MSAPKNEKTDGFLFKTHKDNLCLNIWFHFGQTQATHNKECNGLILKKYKQLRKSMVSWKKNFLSKQFEIAGFQVFKKKHEKYTKQRKIAGPRGKTLQQIKKTIMSLKKSIRQTEKPMVQIGK